MRSGLLSAASECTRAATDETSADSPPLTVRTESGPRRISKSSNFRCRVPQSDDLATSGLAGLSESAALVPGDCEPLEAAALRPGRCSPGTGASTLITIKVYVSCSSTRAVWLRWRQSSTCKG